MPPVASDFVLEAGIVATTGYVIIVNITSCHVFGLDFVSSAFAADNSRTGVGDKIANKERNEFSTAFIDVLNADTNFVQISVDITRKGARMLIGPNRDFSLYSDPETITMTWRQETFDPRSPNQLSTRFVIRPIVPIDLQESKVSDTSSLVISFISLAVSNPTTAALVGKVEMLANAIECPIFLTDASLSIDQNPFNIGFGNERKLYYHVGSVLINPLLLFCAFIAHFIFVLILAAARSLGSARDGHFERSLITLRFPGFSLVLVIFFYQGTITSAFTVFAYSTSAFYSFGAMCVLLLGLTMPLLSWLRVIKRHFFALRASTETPEARTSAVIRYIIGVGEWIDRGRHYRGFVKRYGSLFDEFRPRRQWFLAVELCFLYFYGIMDAIAPKTRFGCVVVSALMTVSLWIYLIVIVGLHPHHNNITYLLYILIAVTQLVASLLISVGHILQDEKQQEDVMYSATIALLVSVTLTMFKMLHDFVIIGFLLIHGRERNKNVATWKMAAKRKVRVTRLARQREDDIRFLLEHELDDNFEPTQKRDYDSAQDSLDIPDCDEQEPQQIVSSVKPVINCPPPTDEERDTYFRVTGMTKDELWKVL